MCCMAMGTGRGEQGSMWVATAELPKSPGHPFYTRLNALLDADDFDGFVEGQCARFYAPVMGRPSLALADPRPRPIAPWRNRQHVVHDQPGARAIWVASN